MAVSYVGAGAIAVVGNGDSINVAGPTCVYGDILIATCLVKDNRTVSAPNDEWTEFVDLTNTANMRVKLFWRVAIQSAGTYTFTANAAVNNCFAAVISAWRECNNVDPFDATAPSTSPNASSDTVTYATYDPAETNAYVVAIGVYNNDLTTAGAIGGSNPTLTNRFDLETATGTDCSFFGYSGTSDGAATGARTHTTTSTVDAINVGIMFGFKNSPKPRNLSLLGAGH